LRVRRDNLLDYTIPPGEVVLAEEVFGVYRKVHRRAIAYDFGDVLVPQIRESIEVLLNRIQIEVETPCRGLEPLQNKVDVIGTGLDNSRLPVA
jgi:hypothetical protein